MENIVDFIAKVCHEANKSWCEANGDTSQKHWEDAEPWQRSSALLGVQFRLDNPDAGTMRNIIHGWLKRLVKGGSMAR